MSITMNVWIIALTEFVSGPVKPVYYYNPYNDTWSKESKLGCAFVTEKEAQDKLEEIGVDAEIIAVTANME